MNSRFTDNFPLWKRGTWETSTNCRKGGGEFFFSRRNMGLSLTPSLGRVMISPVRLIPLTTIAWTQIKSIYSKGLLEGMKPC